MNIFLNKYNDFYFLCFIFFMIVMLSLVFLPQLESKMAHKLWDPMDHYSRVV